MDSFDADDDPTVAGVVELLRRERPVLTHDEFERVERRLSASKAPRPARRRGSRVAVMISLALGLLFMTAGTGLAISGLATPGAADNAQYPDQTTGTAPASTPARTNSRRIERRTLGASNLGDSSPAAGTTTVYVRLRQAEAHSDLPFTGFGAIPILVAGIVFIGSGAALNRGTRRS